MAESNIILTRFLSKYTSIDFFKDIVNVFLYPSEFNTTIGSNDRESIPSYLNSFFTDLLKKLSQYGSDKKSNADKFIETARTILRLRNAGKGLITYNSIDQHFTSSNALIKKLIQDVKNEKITDDESFRQKIDNIVLYIQYFYDFQKALDGFTKIHEFNELLEKPETSPLDAVEKYKEMVIQLDSDMSNLSTVGHEETSTDYYILSDKESACQISGLITDYLCNNYSFYNTGLVAYDNSVSGFESSSVHIIASPSNGGKSITLSNLLYRIAKNNSEEFKEGDAALFITCEDDTVKTTRKFMSVFGNYSYDGVREIYRASHEFISKIKKQKDEIDQDSKEMISNLFNEMLYDSITKTTAGTLKIIFKYAPEQSLSASEIAQQIKKFQLMGINIKYLIIDYLDVLKPSLTYGTAISDEYYTLGVITQELRTLSRLHGIPVITATQTSKIGDNVGQTLTNSMIGESYKKVNV